MMPMVTGAARATGLGLGLLALAACDVPPSLPVIAAQQPIVEEVATRPIAFSARNGDDLIAATCSVTGPGVNARFQTPARLEVLLDDTDRPIITSVKCEIPGQAVQWSDIPGPNTQSVRAQFGGTDEFGETTLLFGRDQRSVQYYTRDRQLVRVAGAPAP